ncbi:HAD family hydrolase [Halomonas heilongjiangensis]|uniref:HAD family hydrolase n=1 Tax=Halomonas heilongjiangensis TaxID=1387883 RepID=UPI00197AB68A|nr:HAD family hydrolase [Halomonas heilongjiangensis]
MKILLDLDGTLTDPKEGIIGCIRHALSALGHAVPDDLALERYIGPPLQASFAEMLPDRADVPRALHAYRERFSEIGMFENAVYPGIPVALEALQQRGAQLYVVTSKPWVFARQIIDHFNLGTYFTDIYGSELDGTRSDKASLIAHVLRESHLRPETAIMVGDRSHDAIGARRNGVVAVGVLWGYGSEAELRGAGVSRVLECPGELGCLLSDQDG